MPSINCADDSETGNVVCSRSGGCDKGTREWNACGGDENAEMVFGAEKDGQSKKQRDQRQNPDGWVEVQDGGDMDEVVGTHDKEWIM